MKLTDWLFGSQPTELKLSNASIGNYGTSKMIMPRAEVLDTSLLSLLKYARRSEIVYACIEKKAQSATDAEIIVETQTPDGEWEQVPNHPMINLLNKPNPWDDGESFIRTWIASENFSDKFYAEIVRSGSGVPVGLYPLNPVYLVPQYDGSGRLLYYYYYINGREITYMPDELLIRHRHGLGSVYNGVSSVMIALGSIDADSAATEYVRAFFNNGGTPSGILVNKGRKLSDTEADAMKQKWQQRFGRGGINQGGVAIIDSEQAEWQSIGSKLTDLNSEALDDKAETRICCLPDTKIVTQRGLVAIPNVVVGDKVITHTGQWKTVTKTMSNPVHDQVFEIKANGFDALRVTGNHPVYAGLYEQDRSHLSTFDGSYWVAARDIKPKKTRGDFHAVTMPVMDTTNAAKGISLDNHIKGRRFAVNVIDGRLVHAHPLVKTLPIGIDFTSALGRILGFYLAEGSTGDGKTLFYFHRNETDYHKQVVDDLADVFGLTAQIKPIADTNVTAVICQNAMLTELLECGTARTKTVPAWAWEGTSEFFEAMLWAWSVGDGCVKDNGTRVATSSIDLAWQMRIVAVSCGFEASLRSSAQPKSFINGREIKAGGDIYIVSWTDKTDRKGTYRIEDNQLCSPVRSNDPIPYDGMVYNLEVEDDHSYLTTGGMVHNCMAFGVPPILIGALSGLRHVTQNATAKAALTDFWINTMSPELKGIRKFLTWNLLPMFEGMDAVKAGTIRANWNLAQVGALQEDIDKIAARAVSVFQGGLVTLNEGRSMIQMDAVEGEEGDVFYHSSAPALPDVIAPEPPPKDKPKQLGEGFEQQSILDADTLEKKTNDLTYWRELTPIEQTIDLKSMVADFDNGKARMAAILLSIRDDLIKQSVGAMRSMDGSGVHELTLTPPAKAYARVSKEIDNLFTIGRNQITDELKRQGKSLASPDESKKKGDWQKFLARISDLVISRIISEISTRAINFFVSRGLLSRDDNEIIAELRAALEDQSTKTFEDIASQATNSAIGEGRDVELTERADDIEVYEYSAILDSGTCDPCEEADGKRETNADDLPEAPNPDCLGQSRCRCFVVGIGREENA